jgi:hypothetical protein
VPYTRQLSSSDVTCTEKGVIDFRPKFHGIYFSDPVNRNKSNYLLINVSYAKKTGVMRQLFCFLNLICIMLIYKVSYSERDSWYIIKTIT